MELKIDMQGLDEAIRQYELAGRLWLIFATTQLEWFGKTVTTEMKEQPPLGHPPGGPHPLSRDEQPVFGEHAYIDRTGYLTRSIGYTIDLWQGHRAVVSVFALAPHADAVEFGTMRSRPYPFFWPVFNKYLPQLEERLHEAAERAVATAANRAAA